MGTDTISLETSIQTLEMEIVKRSLPAHLVNIFAGKASRFRQE